MEPWAPLLDPCVKSKRTILLTQATVHESKPDTKEYILYDYLATTVEKSILIHNPPKAHHWLSGVELGEVTGWGQRNSLE